MLSSSRLYTGVVLCFFISGASALFFQVLWIRIFSLIFGTTQFAMGTVIAGFLGGLGFGSWLVSRSKTTISRPLFLYGILELFIGIYGLLFPFICQLLIPIQEIILTQFDPGFYGFSFFRLIFALLILLPPTTAMGATLPILSQFCQHQLKNPITGISFLYAINTLGASLGALISGLWLIPSLGLIHSNYVAVSSNFIILFLAILLAKQVETTTEKATKEKPLKKAHDAKTSSIPNLLIGIIVASSLLTLILELVWSRVLEMILGSTVYVVSSILTAFILGLGIGSFISSIALVHRAKPYFWLGIVFVFSAVLLLGSLYLLDELPIWLVVFFYTPLQQSALYLKPLTGLSLPTILITISILFSFFTVGLFLYLTYKEIPFHYFFIGSLVLTIAFLVLFFQGIETIIKLRDSHIGEHFNFFFLIKFSMICCIILPPCILLGMVFPLGLSALNTEDLRKQVGQLYFYSTIGSIFGSLVGGFLIIPLLGVKNTFFAIIGIGFLLGFYLMFQENKRKGAIFASLVLVLLLPVLLWFPPPFNEHILASGVIQYIHRLGPFTMKSLREDFEAFRYQTLSHRDGVTATITLKESERGRSLKVNGKVDASTQQDMYTQILLGQIPLLLTESQKQVLVIGYGSGVTLGSVLTHEKVEQATIVEIEQEVLNASKYFSTVHLSDPLKHPKTHIEINDARNFLLLTPKKFDVIISEPSNPWMTGASKLFTQEFYEITKEKLTSNGIMACWIQLYGMDQNSLHILFNTFQTVFPYVYLFKFKGDMLLIGKESPIHISEKMLYQRFTPLVRKDIERLELSTLSDIFSYFVLAPKGVKQLLPIGYEIKSNPPKLLKRKDVLYSFNHKPLPDPKEWTSLKRQTVLVEFRRGNKVLQAQVSGDLLAQLKCRKATPQLNTDNLPLIEYQAPRNIFSKEQKKLIEWLNSVPGQDNLPEFVRWESIKKKKHFQDQLFNLYLLRNEIYKARECIQWSTTLSNKDLFKKQLEWKFHLFQNDLKRAKKIFDELEEPFVVNTVENKIFNFCLNSERSKLLFTLLKLWKTDLRWQQSPELSNGFEAFIQEEYQKSLEFLDKWDSKKKSTPFQFFLFKAICLEKNKKPKHAMVHYNQFFQGLLNQIISYDKIKIYLQYLQNNTQIKEVIQQNQKIYQCLNKLHQAIKLNQQAKNEKQTLKLFQECNEEFPQSYLILSVYLKALAQVDLEASIKLQEESLQKIEEPHLAMRLAFQYKVKGLQGERNYFQKSIQLYQKALTQTWDLWAQKELKFRIQSIEKLLDEVR